MESPAVALTCTQCGGELHPDEGQLFVTCPFCSSTVYVDRSRVVFHWYVAPTLSVEQASAALRRWMAGNQTVKDLDKKSQITSQVFEYFPLWLFKFKNTPQEKEQISLLPAAATSVTELAHLPLPAGDLQRYESSIDAQAAAPTVPLEAALEWIKQGERRPTLSETSLVHVPVYFFKYKFAGKVFTAVVDAASGVVLANIFPAKAEAPYLVVGILTAMVYLCLALMPVLFSFGEEPGAFVGIAIFIIGGVIAAPILFGLAFWVAAKV
jgi:predicted RNA-binding Zn-ribbon protein involved in translation (DUF1610 family)